MINESPVLLGSMGEAYSNNELEPRPLLSGSEQVCIMDDFCA